jgi:lysozyme family protein
LAHPTVDIVNLTKEQALAIYHRDYWLRSGADNLPWPLALVHFDAYVQNPGAAIRFLQASGGNPVLYVAERVEWYTTINNWEHHGKGWMRRCATMLREVAK